jgi:uncharacterized protein (AIM24 family)
MSPATEKNNRFLRVDLTPGEGLRIEIGTLQTSTSSVETETRNLWYKMYLGRWSLQDLGWHRDRLTHQKILLNLAEYGNETCCQNGGLLCMPQTVNVEPVSVYGSGMLSNSELSTLNGDGDNSLSWISETR